MGELDWMLLSEQTETKRAKYRFDDVRGQVRKIAFDVFKATNGDSLWQLQEDDDGQKFLYAIYGEPAELTATSADINGWKATPDRDGKNVSLAFKNLPLIRFASAEHGFDPAEATEFAQFLETKVQDPEFVAKMSASLPENKRALLQAELTGSTN